MRPQKVEDKDLIQGLMAVLRTKGYEGASLNELAAASGLQKASLYHRFPGGKKEITSAVLTYVAEWMDEHVLNLLLNEKLTPGQCLEKVLQNINALYDHGRKACILRALSLDTGIDLFGEELRLNVQKWLDGFKALGRALGQSEAKAQHNALASITHIQGGLVVSKAINSTLPFQQALEAIKLMYS